jgi:hypothetical protein
MFLAELATALEIDTVAGDLDAEVGEGKLEDVPSVEIVMDDVR